MTTAIYARISKDADLRGLGVARQLADCKALAERRGWEDVETFVDNDVSASSGKRRPEYERLLEGIRGKTVQAVVVWDIDRLTRRPAELETFIGLADTFGLALASVGGEVDLASPQGRLTARIKGAVARHEVEQQSRRIRRKVEELAAAGMPHTGGLRPFGYDVSRLQVVEEEAVLIRDAARRVLAKESLRSVTRGWNEKGIRSVTGRPWSVQSLRNVLLSPRMAGLVEHRGRVVGPAKWPAVLDAATHEALRHVLLDPTRGTTVTGRPRAYWWSGMVFCGRCEARMGASGTSARRQWRCLIDYGGCGRTTMDIALLEPVLRAAVLSHVSPFAVAGVGGDAGEDRGAVLDAAIAGAEARLDALAAEYAEDEDGDAGAYRRASRALEARLSALRDERAELVVAAAEERARPDLAALAGEFDALSVERRAQVAAMIVERVRVMPGVAGRRDSGRVRVEYRLAGPAAVE